MRFNLLIIGLFSLFLVSACGDKNSEGKVKILDSQLKAMDKARSLEADINAAAKKRSKEIDKMSR